MSDSLVLNLQFFFQFLSARPFGKVEMIDPAKFSSQFMSSSFSSHNLRQSSFELTVFFQFASVSL